MRPSKHAACGTFAVIDTEEGAQRARERCCTHLQHIVQIRRYVRAAVRESSPRPSVYLRASGPAWGPLGGPLGYSRDNVTEWIK